MLVGSVVSVSDRLVVAAKAWSQSQYELVALAAELADGPEWILAGSPTAAHHVALIADVEASTAREWLRVGKRVRGLPAIAELFADNTLSYSKVRALIAVATPVNEAELAEIAKVTPAGKLRLVLALWLKDTSSPEDMVAHHRSQRSAKWRVEPDGMVSFNLRLAPHLAAILIALLTTVVMRSKPRPNPKERWPTLAQQHADAIETLVTNGAGDVATEVVLHVRGDGCTTDDGTPIPDTIITDIAPTSFLRALIHDAEGRANNASGKQRHPSTRQKRVVKERDRTCIDCGRPDLLQYDHQPAYETTRRTVVTELKLRCAPCHHKRHHNGG